MAQSKKVVDDILKCSIVFNTKLKYLARIYALKKKGTFDEEKAYRNNQRLAIVISEDPLWLMEQAGPSFLKYANLISTRNWDAFVNIDFADEKKAYKNTDDGSDKTDDKMRGHIQFIKKIFSGLNAEELESVGDAVNEILGAYCSYALIVKREL
jgi:hypothetical protein